MRISEARLIDVIAGAELGESLGYSGNIIDHLALDLRDALEAVKILKGLSDSQTEALDMMEKGQL
jgi:hypothetical protein